jgi:hypothetical protein
MQDDKNQEQDLTRKIKERAFRIWVEEGQPSGRYRQHWEQAKAEVIASQPSE